MSFGRPRPGVIWWAQGPAPFTTHCYAN